MIESTNFVSRYFEEYFIIVRKQTDTKFLVKKGIFDLLYHIVLGQEICSSVFGTLHFKRNFAIVCYCRITFLIMNIFYTNVNILLFQCKLV